VTVLTLYGKPGCHLCDEARAALATLDAEVHEVDVSVDPRLHAEYGERIPVVELDGVEVARFHVDLADLKSRLDKVAP
jgi:glutaredoxin